MKLFSTLPPWRSPCLPPRRSPITTRRTPRHPPMRRSGPCWPATGGARTTSHATSIGIPVEALGFWGLAPGMTVLEVQPGGGWWTEILAPYAKRTGGRFHATAVDLSNPEVPEAARKARTDFEKRYAANPDVYGRIELVNWGLKSPPLPAKPSTSS